MTMNLGTRIGVTMAALVGVTAFASAIANVSVTSRRLDAEIRRSIDLVAIPVSRNLDEAKRTCGLTTPSADRSPGSPRRNADGDGGVGGGDGDERGGRGGPLRRVPRELIVQCLDTTGAVMATSPSSAIPIDDATRTLASVGGKPRLTRASFNDDRHLVLAVPVPTFGVVQIARQVEERDRVLSGLIARNVWIALVSALLAIAAAAVLARRITRPLRHLTEVTEHIGATADVTAVELPKTAHNDEVGRLSASFASMVASLRDSKHAQSRLVQDAGHELRTPLTSLRVNVALLGRENLTPETRAQVRADVEAELRELTLVTNELVALAADTASTEPPVLVDLWALVQSTTQRWARRSDRTINTTHATRASNATDATTADASDRSTVLIAETAARRVFDNLLSNAIKFSPDEAPIDVTLRTDEQRVVVSVRDHGPGIAPADLSRVFDRFYRSDEARSVSGSGLGLSIVKDLVLAAGGDITASAAPGGGAIFTVSLPLASSTGEHANS